MAMTLLGCVHSQQKVTPITRGSPQFIDYTRYADSGPAVVCKRKFSNQKDADKETNKTYTKDEATNYLTAYQRLSQVSAKIENALADEYTKRGYTLPFSTYFLDANVWKGAGMFKKGSVQVTAISYPDKLVSSRIKVGDEIISVNSKPFVGLNNLKKLIRSFPNAEAPIVFKFRRDGEEWEEEVFLLEKPYNGLRFALVDTITVPYACTDGKHFVLITPEMVKLASSDDELAYILCHEIAHIQLGHYKSTRNINFGTNLLSALTAGTVMALLNYKGAPTTYSYQQNSWKLGKATGDFTGAWLTSPFSQKDERSADKLSLHLMHKAGYNLDGAVSTLNKFKSELKGKNKAMDFKHPKLDERIKYMTALSKEIKEGSTGTEKESITLKAAMVSKEEKVMFESFMKKIENLPAVPGALNANLQFPRSTVESVFNAQFYRNGHTYLACFTDEYFTAFGESLPEAKAAELKAVKEGHYKRPADAYQIVQIITAGDSNRARVVYKIKKKYLSETDYPDAQYAYLLTKTAEGWKVYGRDQTLAYSKTWRYTKPKNEFEMLPLAELKAA